MTHDVFISYSSKDKTIADAVCAMLEGHKIRCWIAPRDVPPGQPFASALIHAISASRILVLILSSDANNSVHVLREVGEAVDHGIPVVPLRIEDIQPSEEMRYYIKSIHWLDALTPPMERHLEKLVHSVQALLGVEGVLPLAVTASEPGPTKKARPTFPKWAFALAAVAVLAFGAVLILPRLGLFQSGNLPGAPADEENTPASSAPEAQAGAEGGDWTPVSFVTPNLQLWDVADESSYTAVGQRSSDAFAWSAVTFDGDMNFSFDLQGALSSSEGCVILYGGGVEFSDGSLIFCLEQNYYQLEKHTRYHEGENFLAYTPSGIALNEGVYSTTIQIAGDTATMYVNGERVLSAFFDLGEIPKSGRIGLLKPWTSPGVTFSNLRVQLVAE